MVGSFDNPFSALTAVAAPALLTNASTVLVLGLGNRIARVVDRTRTVAAVMATVTSDSELYRALQYQRELLEQRRVALSKAIRLGYAAVGGFAAEVLISVLGAVLLTTYSMKMVNEMAAILALGIGFISVGCLVTACIYMVRETTIALDNLFEEARTVAMESVRHNAPPC